MQNNEQVEERVEYRVVGESHGGERWEGTPRVGILATIQPTARELARRNKRVVIQKRTVSTTPWEDVADE